MAPNQEPNLHRRRTRICIICTEERRVGTEFPTSPVTATCNHPSPQACLTCISQHIKTSLESHKWGDIHCPECHELMAYQELARFADPETFARIEAGSVSAAIKEDPLLFECTRPECGYSQIHADGYEWPIFQCARCGALSCFTHNAPWHEFLTCEEYEISFEGAEGVNSRSQIQPEEEEGDDDDDDGDANFAKALQEQEDFELALRLAGPWEDEGLARRTRALSLAEREPREERRHDWRGAQAERQREERHDRREERREDDKRHRHHGAQADNEHERKRRLTLEKQKEDSLSAAAIQHTAKRCPGCKAPIEKNEGCDHMTCSQCRYEFCWVCRVPWSWDHPPHL